MKEDLLTFRGKVIELLPNALFKVKLENNHVILCTISGKMKKNRITIILHDDVSCEMSPYDVTKGRITYRFKL